MTMASDFSLYLLMVLLSATCCHSDPIIMLTANTSYAMGLVGVYEGASLKLTCQVENLDDKVVGWIFRTTRIRANTNTAKYEVTTNGSLSTLTILNLMRVQDAGPYSCGVYLSDEFSDPEVRETLEILVYYFPGDMYPICIGPTVITEGESVTFRCESEPGDQPVDLTWRRDSGTIQESISTGEQNGKKFAEYTFQPSKNDNGMTAYCIISSNAIFKDLTSNCSVGPLSVQYPPTGISLTNQNVSYSNSTYDAILCSASAFPTDISYTWSFTTFLDSSQQTLINGNQTLVILNVTMCEFPIIATCHASNDIGNAAANYTLCEPPPPPNPVCYPNNQVVLTEGVPQMFQCVSYSEDANATDVVWSRDEGLISADDITTGDLPNSYKYSNYTFVPMRDDFGIIVTCSLPDGTIFQNYCVIGPLLIQYISSDVAITNGTFLYENMTYEAFSCESSAFSFDISYSWNFNTPLSASQHLLTNDNQTLVILNITTCEILIIASCLATNDIGEYSANVTLCEPPPPPPSTTQLIMTTGTSKPITSIGPASTGLPITITDQAATTPKPLPPTLAFYIVIIGVAILALIALLGICYIALTPSNKSLGKMDMKETDQEIGQHKSINVQLKRDSRIFLDANPRRSILFMDEGIPEESAMDNPGFDMKTFDGDNNIPQEVYLLEEVVDTMSPNNPESEEIGQTQDSSNNTDFGSQGKDRGDANQGQDESLDKPALKDKVVYENFIYDGNQGNNKR
ncbi:uncharacterized protein [Asterias amurensis]|uniref:uncharacterized protein n=1 Tax=Asterias amurensis TaxID=7602 RepID=UPI003AB1EED4